MKLRAEINAALSLWAALLLLAFPEHCTSSEQLQKPPNFLLMMADDLGMADLSLHGNEAINTPNLDRLGRESVQFSQFYVHPVCAPTRASLLTGRDFLRTGVWGVHGARDFINLDEVTFGDALGGAGYSTGLFGKWHNGRTDGYFPWQRGFREAFTTDLYYYRDNIANFNGKPVPTKGWATKNIADWTINFMERNRDHPFVAYVPFMTPHLGKLYGDTNEHWHAPKSFVSNYTRKGFSDAFSRLYGMIEYMDHQVGRIVNSLDDLSLRSNTVVIFLSDNGPVDGELLTKREWKQRNHIPLYGNKGEVFENGIRVPLFIRWPRHFQPRLITDALASITDIFPTLMDLAGVSSKGKKIDGRSLVPLLMQLESESTWSQRALYHTTAAPEWTKRGGTYWTPPNLGLDKSKLIFGEDGRWAVRSGRYKLVHYFGNEYVFDMVDDPDESRPLELPIIKDRLKSLLHNWWAEMVEDDGSFTMPTFQIGWEGSQKSEILAVGAVQTSGRVSLHSHEASGWQTPGSGTLYKIRVLTPGTYNVVADFKTLVNLEIVVTIYCESNRYQTMGWVGKRGFIGTVAILEADEFCLLECLAVDVVENGDQVSLKGLTLERIEE